MRVDAHAHVIPSAYVEAIPTMAGAGPKPPIVSIGQLEEMMAAYGIDKAVVSTGPPGVFFGDQGQANEIARLVNEEMAAVRDHEPQRFATLGMVPLPDVAAAIAELGHLLDELQLDGILLTTNVAGVYLGDPALEPFMAELDRRGTYVFVHPTMPARGVALNHPVWLYEFPFDTTRAIINLIYTGTLQRYPNVRWQMAHLGGTAPFLTHRIASLADREPALAGDAPAGAAGYLSRLYYDTGLSNNEIAYRATLAVAPADHIVFGSDWPYLALPPAPDPAPDLAFLGEADRAAFDGANIAALVPRFAD